MTDMEWDRLLGHVQSVMIGLSPVNDLVRDLPILLREVQHIREENAALRDALGGMVDTYEWEAGEQKSLVKAYELLGRENVWTN